MVRPEFVIVGVILVIIGLGLCLFGYQKTQPTLTDTAVGLLEQLSHQKAPEDLKSDKTTGYLMMAVGGGLLLAGIGVILGSRAKVA